MVLVRSSVCFGFFVAGFSVGSCSVFDWGDVGPRLVADLFLLSGVSVVLVVVPEFGKGGKLLQSISYII